MRRLIVKLFALYYSFKIFKTTVSMPRASTIIYPLFLITGIVLAFFTPDYPRPTLLLWFLYFLDAVAVFFGFVYFRIKPIKWEELDDKQKYLAGSLIKLTYNQFIEWREICEKINSQN